METFLKYCTLTKWDHLVGILDEASIGEFIQGILPYADMEM